MKKSFISLSILFFINYGITHAQAFDGWEFLPWKISKDSVGKLIEENKSKLSESNALDADFKYQGMNTWLIYNDADELIKVHQRKTFSVIYKEEAEAFFKVVKADFTKKYGKQENIVNNRKEDFINIIWKLKYTKIILNYDYKYKIIDEFGADSYWIDVIFEPVISD